MAWLAATPKEATESRRSQIERLAESCDMDPDYGLPDLDGAEYIVSALSSVGEARVDGDRLVAVSWTDITGWISATGASMTAGEVEAIKHLSVSYVNQYYKSIEPGTQSPCIPEAPPADVVLRRLDNLFTALRRT